jgi:hypothetical protein
MVKSSDEVVARMIGEKKIIWWNWREGYPRRQARSHASREGWCFEIMDNCICFRFPAEKSSQFNPCTMELRWKKSTLEYRDVHYVFADVLALS